MVASLPFCPHNLIKLMLATAEDESDNRKMLPCLHASRSGAFTGPRTVILGPEANRTPTPSPLWETPVVPSFEP